MKDMKNIINIVVILIFVILFSFCVQKKNEPNLSIKTIELNPNNSTNLLSTDSLVEKVVYIPISDSILIGDIYKMLQYKEKFIILDRTKTHSVFIIDQTGKNIIQINKQGAGPEEYIDPKDISIDYKTEDLFVFCGRTHRLISYDLNGNYRKEDKIQKKYNSHIVHKIGSNYALFVSYKESPLSKQGQQYPNLALISGTDQKEIATAEYFQSDFLFKRPWFVGKDFADINKNIISINPEHSNMVYHITPTSITPKYFIDFGDYNLDSEYLEKIKRHKVSDPIENETKGYCIIMRYTESDKYIFLTYMYNNELYYVLFSKKSNKILHFQYTDKPLFYSKYYLVGNKIYSFIDPYNLRNDTLLKSNTELSILQEEVIETSNPIIVETTLRDF